jgi:hypothetical protein
MARSLRLVSIVHTPDIGGCQHIRVQYNKEQYNDWFPVMPAHTNPTWRAQPVPSSNRDVGERMPGGHAQIARVQWRAGEISAEQRPPFMAGFSLH